MTQPGPPWLSDAADEERIRQAVKSLPVPKADPAFRERLKADFCSGAILARGERTRAAAGLQAGVPWWRSLLSAPRLWIPAAAAAAAGLALVVGLLNQGPAWTVTSIRGSGVARVDGVAVPLSTPGELSRRLTRGAQIEIPEGAEIDLLAGRTLAVRVTPGSAFTLPAAPARWFDRDADVRIRHGIVRFATGRDFRGAHLGVYTPEVCAEVTGTTFTVIRDPEIGSCVCVYEGTVQVGRPDGKDMLPVPGGMRRMFYNDKRPPAVREIRRDERVYLKQYSDQIKPLLAR